MSENKKRYTDEELQEFKELILQKKEQAQKDIDVLRSLLDNHDMTQTKIVTFEDSASTYSKESNLKLIGRLERFVRDLDNALIRIENKTYGICRETGKLISKKRLMAVPHATLSIEAKNRQDSK
ncbi:MAG TPA: TraR/DksA family transcriptional regulator [Flavobacteriales bacterium]|nr:TraR/DksA family transcriptional regulator [Flavobacteriales bacterium]